MSTRNRLFTGLFLIIALILIIQPASAATQSYMDPGYNYDVGYVASGAWQIYDLDVTSTDDYNILALVYNHVNDFDLYVVDPTTHTYITSATAPYSTENGLDFIWAISTLKPGKYSVYVHSTSGAGNFAFIHFYNRQPIMKTVGTPKVPVIQGPVVQAQDPIIGVWSRYSSSTGFDDKYQFNADGTYIENYLTVGVFYGMWSAQGSNSYTTRETSTGASETIVYNPAQNCIYSTTYPSLLYTPYQGNVMAASAPVSTPTYSPQSPSSSSAHFSGNGDDVISFTTSGTGLRIFTMRHTGDSNFIIKLKDGDGNYRALLVNEIGSYSGRTSESLTTGKYYLDVSADGAWTIDITNA